ncbi:MAG: type I polyketide synthase, partial [Myxococcota bacterium]
MNGEPITGVFAGSGLTGYLIGNLLPNREILRKVGSFQITASNDKDFLPLRAAYLLDLRGPAINVNTSCSTSLAAVHLARQSLLEYECDMALAGAATVHMPERSGYLYEEGGILSPEGTCKPFAIDARGTVNSNGVAVVVLKRVEDAVADGDPILAILRSSAMNNDGAAKIGFTAPSIDGQAQVIAGAQQDGDVSPHSIGYLEAHGTGTALGDRIELAGLRRAFELGGDRTGFCALGGIKANIGHVDTAAGIAGLIKVVMALRHRELPPSLYCDVNPALELDRSPFYLNDRLRPWPTGPEPRRAGVSSFGIGGTNVHVIVEEALLQPTSGSTRRTSIAIPVSAASVPALRAQCIALADHLDSGEIPALADVAYTLQRGRRPL